MYEEGKGVEKNTKSAIEWCRKAVDKVYEKAQSALERLEQL